VVIVEQHKNGNLPAKSGGNYTHKIDRNCTGRLTSMAILQQKSIAFFRLKPVAILRPNLTPKIRVVLECEARSGIHWLGESHKILVDNHLSNLAPEIS